AIARAGASLSAVFHRRIGPQNERRMDTDVVEVGNRGPRLSMMNLPLALAPSFYDVRTSRADEKRFRLIFAISARYHGATMPHAAPSPALTAPPKSPTPLLLTGAQVLDPGGERWTSGHDVLLREGRIERIAPPQEVAAPADARRIDLTERFLIPGLIDLHTHLLLQPYTSISWDDQILRESLERRTLIGAVSSRETLESGFTTVRDLGTEG